jgi:hypothetical protein
VAVLDRVEQKAEQVIDSLRPAATPIPPDVAQRIKRGKARLKELQPRRQLCIEFANDKHYGVLAEDGSKIRYQGTVSTILGGKKPDHRVRRSHDLIGPMVQAKVSAATQRIPGYEVNPSTSDPEDYTAAQIAKKIVSAGYELWRVKRAFQKLVWNALVTEEGFIMAYWDSSIGPYVDVQEDPEGKAEHVGLGDVRISVWNGLEVMWEPGVDFEESRWWAIEHARPRDAVEAEPGFMGGKLPADAQMAVREGANAEQSNLCLITEYLERPCPQWPQGRRIFLAAGKQIFPEEAYPLTDSKGEVVDEPCIHRLGYTVNPASDRDKGMVKSLIESQRLYDFALNKISEFAQIGLVPQKTAPLGAIKTPATDEPGAINEFDPSAMMGYEVKFGETMGIPSELFKLREEAQGEMGYIAHDSEIPAAAPQQVVSSILQRDEISWEDMVANMAEVYARVARDCLTLVQRHYTEERMLKFRGRAGYMPIEDFKGADLRDQTDVRVQPGSLTPQTRSAIEQRIQNIAQMFPGYFPPEVLLSAMNNGNAEGLLEGYEEDVGRINYIINQIRSGQFWSMPMRPAWPGEESPRLNPETGEPEWIEPPEPEIPGEQNEFGEEVPGTGQPPNPGRPVMETEVPSWMPRPNIDNVQVWESVLANWAKSDEFANSGEEVQKATMLIFQGIEGLKMKEAQQKAQLQNQLAESQGLSNAAAPQTKQAPSLAAVNGSSEEGPKELSSGP